MNAELQTAFDEIGAHLAEEKIGRRFEIDIVRREGGEAYQLQQPRDDVMTFEIVDVHRRLRHLVLDVSGFRLPIAGRYLCGHDESHWFVSGLEFGRQTQSVRGAMESLKPLIVRREQRRKGVKRGKDRRRTAAYVRQGEWFFLPRPKMIVAEPLLERNGKLTRRGGKPHLVDELYRVPGGDEIFVRGRVRHADHQTIVFDVWHRVVQNNEFVPQRVAFAQRIVWSD